MDTIEKAMKAALEKITNAEQKQERPVTDEDIARLIGKLANEGYKPSPQIIPILRDYLAGYGLLLTGRAGVGKTFLMKCLHGRVVHVSEIVDFGLGGIKYFHESWDKHELMIDDLGVEGVINEYGNKDDLMKSVIAHRCERVKARTHITTNLDAAEIADRYGDRTLSRIMGMCRAHKIEAQSMRKAVPHVR